MDRWELFVTWGLLVWMILALRRLAQNLELAREEVEEFRKYMMGEKRDESS